MTATAFPSSNSLLTASTSSNDNGFSALGGGGSFYQSGYQQLQAGRSSFGGSGAPVPAALSALVDMFLVVPQQL